MPTDDELISAIRHCPPDEYAGLFAEYYELVDARFGEISALLFACYIGRPDVAAAIAKRRREIDVFEAAALGDLATLDRIMEADVSRVDAIAPDGFQPLGLACFFGQEAAAAKLADRGADVASPSKNASRVAPLHSAVAARKPAIVAMLLAHGAPVDARQIGGFTPLMAAALNGDVEIVDMLLAAGADPSLRDDTEKTAADHAASKGHAQLVQRLG